VLSLRLVSPLGYCIALEQTVTRADRRKGLLQRDGLGGALLIDRCRSVHTIGMRFALDVAFVSLETSDVVDASERAARKRETIEQAGPGSARDQTAVIQPSAHRINLRINRVLTMAPNRFGLPRIGSNAVLEAEAGSFARWGLAQGQRWSVER
jgi:uncharacterized protein